MDAGLHPESRVARHRHGRLGDQQASTGALRVILRHQVIGDVLTAGAAAGQWRHEDPVGCRYRTQAKFAEQIGHRLNSRRVEVWDRSSMRHGRKLSSAADDCLFNVPLPK